MSATSDITYTQLGMEEGGSAHDASSNKRGHSRAVIIVNAIMVCGMLLSTVSVIVGVEFLEMTAADADHDQVKQMGKQVAALPLGFLVVRNILLAIMFAVGILGAVKYNPQMVQVAYVGYAVKLLFDIREGAVMDMMMDVFFAYPHFYFLKEMKEHVMTPNNYPNEAQCCC
jgi:cytochrome bd-type quinol oxidase subunit 2